MFDEHLDTSSFQEIFQKAVDHWQYKTGNEQIYPSDISYTLLEMMAMLCDMLNYYMEQISPAEKQCYTHLLQAEEKPETVSFPLFLHNQTTQTILKHQLFQVQKGYTTYFLEAQKATMITPTKLKAVYYQDGNVHERIDHLLRQREGIFEFPLYKQQGELIILISQQLMKDTVHTLYIWCDDTHRNPKGICYSFANVEVSCYTKQGWKQGIILEDQTWGFLYSGCIRIRLIDDMQQVEYEYTPVYALRFTLKDAQYDHSPCLMKLQFSTIEAKAQKHISLSYDIWCTSHKDNHLHIEDDISNMELLVLKEDMRTSGLYHEVAYEVRHHTTGYDMVIKNHKYPLHIRVICTRSHEYETHYHGVTSQKIHMKEYSLEYVMVKTAAGYRHIPCYQMLEEAPYGYGCWIKEEGLQFGNGRDFKIMEAGKLWYGNLIQYGSFVSEEVLQSTDIQFELPKSQPIPHLSETIRTKEEFMKAVLQMPTLAIDHVRVYGCNGVWTVYIHNKNECYSKSYLQFIEAYLQPYIIIGIQLKVDILQMIPIDIILSNIAEFDKEGISKQLHDFFQTEVRSLTKAMIMRLLQINSNQLEISIHDTEKILKENECFYLRQIAFK